MRIWYSNIGEKKRSPYCGRGYPPPQGIPLLHPPPFGRFAPSHRTPIIPPPPQSWKQIDTTTPMPLLLGGNHILVIFAQICIIKLFFGLQMQSFPCPRLSAGARSLIIMINKCIYIVLPLAIWRKAYQFCSQITFGRRSLANYNDK